MKKLSLLMAAAIIGLGANAADYYLIGGFDNWTLKDANAKFTETEEAGVYTLNYQGTLTSGFKINDGTWSNGNANWGAGSGSLQVGEWYTLNCSGSSGNINMSEAVENPTLTFKPAQNLLLVEGQAQEMVYDFYLRGNMNGWGASDEYKFTRDEKIYTLSGVTLGAGVIFKIGDASWSESWSSCDMGMTTDIPYDMVLTSEGGNMAMEADVENATIVFNYETKVMTITGEQAAPTIPDNFYIIGNVNGQGWDPANQVSMERTETGFTATFTIGNAGDGYGYFSFTQNQGTAGDWGSLGQRWGATANNYVLVNGDEASIQMGENAFKVEGDQEISLAIDWATKVLTFNASVYVNEINASSETVYFNLQGARIAQPENGIYVRVKDGKASKVAVR